MEIGQTQGPKKNLATCQIVKKNIKTMTHRMRGKYIACSLGGMLILREREMMQ